MKTAARRYGLFPALFLAVSFAFLSCNDKSSSDTPPQSKLEDPNLPPIGTVANNCTMSGGSCATAAQCCGFGECISGACNAQSCIQPGEQCDATHGCCQGSCIASNAGVSICH